jgi:hypothetical protein
MLTMCWRYDGWRSAYAADGAVTTARWFPTVRTGILRSSGCYLKRQLSQDLPLTSI